MAAARIRNTGASTSSRTAETATSRARHAAAECFDVAVAIATRRGVMAIHEEPAYPEPLRIALPHTEAAARDVLMLPLFPGLTDEQQDYVIERLAAHVVALAA